MNEKKKWYYLPVMLINLFAILLSSILNVKVFTLAKSITVLKISAGLILISLLACLYYILRGASKNANVSYKLYLLLIALSFTFSSFCATKIDIGSTLVGTLLNLLCALLVAVLALKKDFGKSNSLIVCGVIFTIKMILFILSITGNYGAEFRDTYLISVFNYNALAGLTLASVIGIGTYAKYADKQERHSN